MIEFRRGNILATDAEALVNTVNCVGIMGRGIALQFRNMYPDNFKTYETACRRDEVQPGEMFVYITGRLTNPRYIINFPTKRHWRGKSRIADIESGLVALVREVQDRKIRSIAIPPLGCGLGGLDWDDVRPLIEHAFADQPHVHVVVFEPTGESATQTQSKEIPKMTPGRAALVGLMQQYLSGLLDPFVTLLEVHKLMYFMQEGGEALKLRYVKALYGPYAENLRQVLTRIEGHFVSGYLDGGDAPDKQLELVPGAVKEAQESLKAHPATLKRFGRVAELVEGFETPFGLELLATVHWLATREGTSNPDATIAGVYAWNDRKKRFAPEQIRLAWDVLRNKEWI